MLSSDLTKDKPYGTHLLDEPIVLFRVRDNTAIALADKCAHRSVPLSVGSIVDGVLECKYHGWQYDGDGKVTYIPALMEDRAIPSNACTKKFPVSENQGLIWVWIGDEQLLKQDQFAQPRNLLPGKGANEFGRVFTYSMDLDICASLMLENLLDPSHLPFTHDGTISKRSKAEPLRMDIQYKRDRVEGKVVQTKTGTEGQKFAFLPPCHVNLELVMPDGKTFCQTMHTIPLKKGHSRVIYQQSRNFFTWVDSLPFMGSLYMHFSRKIIFQDYEMLKGQQDRLRQGAKEWNSPIQIDNLPKAFRQWWKLAMKKKPWFQGYSDQKDIEDLIPCYGEDSGKKCDFSSTYSLSRHSIPKISQKTT